MEADAVVALVERIRQTDALAKVASEARRLAHEAYQAALKTERRAWDDFHRAQNALLVAAGGTDMSFAWGLSEEAVAEKK